MLHSSHLLLCLSLVVAGCGSASARVGEAAPGARAPLAVLTVPAQAVTVPVTLKLEGTLGARRQAQLSPLVSGHVVSIAVELGDRVHAGATLLAVRATEIRLTARAARARADAQLHQLGLTNGYAQVDVEKVASVTAAKAEVDKAADELRRQTRMRTTGAVTEQSYEQAALQHTARLAQYESARQAVEGQLASYVALRSEAALRENEAANTVLRAPFAGSISRKLAEIGEYVSPQSSVLELVDTSELRLTLHVPERYAAQVHEGQRVQVSVDGTDVVRSGMVSHLSASLDESSRTLTVEVAVPNSNGALRAGHFARASLELGGSEQLIAVPAHALSERAGVSRVFVVVAGHAEARLVQVIERDAERALVRGELGAGDTVVSAPPRGLADGSQVQG